MEEQRFIIWDKYKKIISAITTMEEFEKFKHQLGWDLEIVPYTEEKRNEYLKRSFNG